MTRIVIAISVVLLLPAVSSASWTLAPCPPDRAKDWQTYERTVRAAEPGSLHYLPKPFPKTDADVIEDYLYQYRTGWGDEPPIDVFPGERRLFEGIQEKTLRFEVVKVENWTTLRCGKQAEEAFYYLLRIFSAMDGAELARGVLSESGHFFMTAHWTEEERAGPADEQRHRVIGLQEALARVRTEFGVLGTAPQYVATFSLGELHCPFEVPCVAFRSGSDVFILSSRPGHPLFRISASGRRLSTKKELKGPNPASDERALGLAPDQRVVSLGGTVYVVAQKVARRPTP